MRENSRKTTLSLDVWSTEVQRTREKSSCRHELARNFAPSWRLLWAARLHGIPSPLYPVPTPKCSRLFLELLDPGRPKSDHQVVQRAHPTRGCNRGGSRRSLCGLVGQGPHRGDGGRARPAVRAAVHGRGQVPRSAARPAGDADELGGLEGGRCRALCGAVYLICWRMSSRGRDARACHPSRRKRSRRILRRSV